jgi:hypothetical protein
MLKSAAPAITAAADRNQWRHRRAADVGGDAGFDIWQARGTWRRLQRYSRSSSNATPSRSRTMRAVTDEPFETNHIAAQRGKEYEDMKTSLGISIANDQR